MGCLTSFEASVRIKPVKVAIDKVKCIGCGTCVAIAPQSFKLTDDGKAEPIIRTSYILFKSQFFHQIFFSS